MYAFNWLPTTFRSESYIGSATALPDELKTDSAFTLCDHTVKKFALQDFCSQSKTMKVSLVTMVMLCTITSTDTQLC